MEPTLPSRLSTATTTRRRLIGLGLAGSATALAPAAWTALPAKAGPPWQIDRADYDAMIAPLATRTRLTHDEGGSWSWGMAQYLLSLVVMYEKFGDTAYLDLFIVDADRLLAIRDSVRGVVDYRGLSLPWWRQGRTYNTGRVTLPTASGPIDLRIGVKGNSSSLAGTVTVTAVAGGRYDLGVSTVGATKTDTFTGLSLDPADPDYLVDRLYWASPNTTRTTARDRRSAAGPGDTLVAGTYNLTSEFFANLVSTGVLTTPLAKFAAAVAAVPTLPSSYHTKATAYLNAAIDALDCHEPEWVAGPAGRGWYRIDPEGASVASGADWPHNQNLAIATTYLYIADASPDATVRAAATTRATELLQRFRDDLTIRSTGTFSWTYWDTSGRGYTGWGPADLVSTRIPTWGPFTSLEDTSHAYLDVLAAVEGHRRGIVFTNADMARLALTFVQDVATTDAGGGPVTRDKFGGSGSTGAYDSRAGIWATLATWEPSILTFLDDLFAARAYPSGFGYPPMSLAYLVANQP